MKPHNVRGFGLIELMLVIGLMGIILAMAIPGYSKMVANGKKKFEVSHMMSALTYAKDTAISKKRAVIVCPGLEVDSSNSIISPCDVSSIWHKRVVSYYEESTTPIKYEHIIHNYDINNQYYWVFSVVGNKKYLRFSADGVTNTQNGSFILCKDKKAYHKIIINKVGRIYDKKSEAVDNNKC